MDDDVSRLIATRRTVLGTGLLVGLSACTQERSSIVVSSPVAVNRSPGAQSSESPGEPSGSSQTPDAPTTQRFIAKELFPAPVSVALGARAAIFFHEDKALVMSSVIQGAQPITLPDLPAQTAYGYAYPVETDVESPAAHSVIILARKTGSGLDGSQDVLTCVHTPHQGSAGGQGEFVVPEPRGQFQGAVLFGGVTIAAISWGEDFEDSETILRVAFDASGAVLWQRTDQNKDQGPRGGVARSLERGEFVTQPGAVTFGIGLSLVTVDIKTGKTTATVKAPSGYGLEALGGSFFALGADGKDGFEKGMVVFEKPSSTIIAKHAESVAIDPIQDTVAIGYHLNDDGDPNFPTALASDPAMVIIKADGSEVYRLPRDKGLALGEVKCVAGYDGRLIVATKENLRVVRAADGSAEPGFEEIPPGKFEAGNIPLRGTQYAVLLGTGGSRGQAGWSGVLLSQTPLTWEDLDFEWLG